MRRIASLIKEGPQGVLETLKTHEQLSYHRGVFAQIHLTSALRIAGLASARTSDSISMPFIHRTAQILSSRATRPRARNVSRDVAFAQNRLWRIGSSVGRRQTDDGVLRNCHTAAHSTFLTLRTRVEYTN